MAHSLLIIPNVNDGKRYVHATFSSLTETGACMLDTISLRRRPGTRKAHDHVMATRCQECSVGCGLLAYVKDERIVDIQG